MVPTATSLIASTLHDRCDQTGWVYQCPDDRRSHRLQRHAHDEHGNAPELGSVYYPGYAGSRYISRRFHACNCNSKPRLGHNPANHRRLCRQVRLPGDDHPRHLPLCRRHRRDDGRHRAGHADYRPWGDDRPGARLHGAQPRPRRFCARGFGSPAQRGSGHDFGSRVHRLVYCRAPRAGPHLHRRLVDGNGRVSRSVRRHAAGRLLRRFRRQGCSGDGEEFHRP